MLGTPLTQIKRAVRRHRDALLAITVLTVATLVTYFPRLKDGGWYGDDWSIHAGVTQHPGGLRDFIELWSHGPIGWRPWYYVYSSLFHNALGDNQRSYILLAVAIGIAVGIAVMLIVRRLGGSWLTAGVIGTLGTISPFATAPHLWASASPGGAALLLVLVAILIALHGLRAGMPWWKVVFWHAVAVVIALAGLTLYEIGATWFAAAGLLYLWVAGRERAPEGASLKQIVRAGYRLALPLWAVDLAVVAYWGSRAVDGTQLAQSSSKVDKGVELLGDGSQVLAGNFVVPFLPRGTAEVPIVSGVSLSAWAVIAILGVALLILVGGAVAAGRRGRPGRWTPLLIAGVGVAVAFLSWAVLISSGPYYTPVGALEGDRVNLAAAYGMAAMIWGVALGAGQFVSAAFAHGERKGRAWAPIAVPAVMLLILAVVGTSHVWRLTKNWNAATKGQNEIAYAVGRAFKGKPPANTIVLMTNNREYLPGGGEIAYTSWIVDGMVRSIYHDRTITGFPHRSNAQYLCRKKGVEPFYIQYSSTPDGIVPWDRLAFVDVENYGLWRPQNKKECEAALQQAALVPYPIKTYPETPAPGTT